MPASIQETSGQFGETGINALELSEVSGSLLYEAIETIPTDTFIDGSVVVTQGFDYVCDYAGKKSPQEAGVIPRSTAIWDYDGDLEMFITSGTRLNLRPPHEESWPGSYYPKPGDAIDPAEAARDKKILEETLAVFRAGGKPNRQEFHFANAGMGVLRADHLPDLKTDGYSLQLARLRLSDRGLSYLDIVNIYGHNRVLLKISGSDLIPTEGSVSPRITVEQAVQLHGWFEGLQAKALQAPVIRRN
ncbi:MAG: hypothetical protein UR81_C0037G0003 [Candidatus Levybacteria bacterium GW2011_GWB1_35_5]|nr:MAG: hypothetical protein UR81_C0037G0003 [Candidatus Levybacteria bacterium GW2011_GWB1_35_5]